MNFKDKIKDLKPYDLNCNVFDVYSYNGLSMQELLCQFFHKINDCIKISNETIDLVSWLVNEGLRLEVVNKLMLWLEDGTLENLINVNLFNSINTKIDDVNTKIDVKIDDVNTKIDVKIDDVNSQLTHIKKQISTYVYSTMTTEEIQELINSSNDITFKQGLYTLTSTLNLKSNSVYRFDENVVLTSNSEIGNIFKSSGGNITIIGNNVTFDLNNKVDNAINIVGLEDIYISNITVMDIKIINRSLTNQRYVSGLTIRYCNNLVLNNIVVNDYGYTNVVNNEVYGVGLHWCNKVVLNDLKINNVMIGLLLQSCNNVSIYNFDIKNTTDNGIYLLLDNKNIIIKDGFLLLNEEGIASYANDITISNVVFDSCTNKGLTLRQGNNYIISNCIFKNNKTDIGDDNNNSSKNILINNCIFTNSVEYSILLRKSSCLKIDNNIFNNALRLNELLRFADTTSDDCNDITISNNVFNLNENVTYALRLAPWNGGCMRLFASCNRFNNCNTAISIYKGSGASGGDNPYLLKNIFNNVAYPSSFSGSVVGVKNENWV